MDERCTAPPAAHQLRRDELLLLGRLAMLLQKVTEGSHVLLEPAVGEIAPVLGKDLGLGLTDRRAIFVRIAEDELAGLQGRAGARRRHVSRALDDWLREPVAVTEMVVGIVE